MNAPYRCAYCGAESWLHPCDQEPPSDYCGEMHHGEPVDLEDLAEFERSSRPDDLQRGSNSHGGNETIPTTTKRPVLPAAPALRINNLGGVADGTRTHDDQNHNLGAQPSIHAGSGGDEGNSCD
jgi:hypothetical protein